MGLGFRVWVCGSGMYLKAQMAIQDVWSFRDLGSGSKVGLGNLVPLNLGEAATKGCVLAWQHPRTLKPETENPTTLNPKPHNP